MIQQCSSALYKYPHTEASYAVNTNYHDSNIVFVRDLTVHNRPSHEMRTRALAYNEVVSIRNQVNLNNPNAVSYGSECQ